TAANDAANDHDVQRFGDARRMGNRSTVQLSTVANGRSYLRCRIPSAVERESSPCVPILVQTGRMVQPGMCECTRRQEIQDAELQQSERQSSIQRDLSIAVRTLASPISATPGSEEPSARRNTVHIRDEGTAATCSRYRGRDSLHREGN